MIFFFGGDDALPSITIPRVFRQLQLNPECVKKLQAEHDAILGSDPSLAAEKIREAPHILASLQYTLGVIKETLRMNPATITIREGQPSFNLKINGEDDPWPTDGFDLFDSSITIHHDPANFVDPLKFMPERFSVLEGDRSHPAKNIWRGFQLGPRKCIGQELAVVVLKLVLVFTVRSFDIEMAWDKWDKMRELQGLKVDRRTVEGERMYTTGKATSHPKDGAPMHDMIRIPTPVEDGSIDELERNSRHVMFDFSALCERAIYTCPGATSVVKYEKREGGFNRVFLLTMDNGSCVVARVPTGIAGPSRLTTNSEVATITYLQSKISLPIPKILDWNDNPSNPTGTEYIIQEHVAGVQLHQEWHKMNPEQHMLCTKALSLTIKKMASLDFPAYGSLYFADAPLDSDLKIPFEQGFCVGPHCSPVFWNRNPGEHELYRGPSPNCGPWRDLTSYCRGLIDTGFSRLPKEAVNNRKLLPYQGSIQDHVRLLKTSREVIQKLIEDNRIEDAATPALLHPDFHKRNIYVSAEEPTVITGLIDWQSTSIEPAFIYTNETPDFATPPRVPEEDPLENEQNETEISRQKERELKDTSVCYQTYDVVMTALVPKLRPARLLDPTLFRLFHYCHTTWRDSAVAVRQELIELSARWVELGLKGSCPYSPTEAELKQHARDYEDFEAVQALKSWLRDNLDTNSDGWISNDAWDAARVAHRTAYNEWIQTAKEAESRGEDMTVAKADKMWPFDAR